MRKIFTLLIVAILATATSWAAEKSIVINTANSGVTGSYANKTFSVDGVTFGFNQWMKSNNIQAKKSTPNSLYNESAIPGKITRVVFKQTGTARAIKVFGGSNVKPTNAIASPKTSGTMEFDFSGKGYTFFSMTTPSNAVYFSQITVYYEDESGKTPTQLSWSAPTATVDLASEVKEFPTLTKNPESLTGITYSSSNADVATVNEATGEIAIVACGQTTIKAAYAGDDTYASSSANYTLRVVDNSIAAGEYTFPINNWFWATNYTGSFKVEKAGLKLQGQQNGISISLGNVNSTKAYVDDNETHTYSSYIMTVNAPEGYVLKKIEFVGTRWQSSTLNASAGNMGAQKIWSGNVSSVEFYFAGTCEIKNVKIAYEKAAPAKTLTSIAITGEPAKTEYTEGDAFSAEGLVVTATYDDASTAVVTADATWSFEPATLAASTTSVTATATYNEKTASETYNVTVKEIPSYTYTWMVNGAEVKKSVLKEGAAVEVPANPEKHRRQGVYWLGNHCYRRC